MTRLTIGYEWRPDTDQRRIDRDGLEFPEAPVPLTVTTLSGREMVGTASELRREDDKITGVVQPAIVGLFPGLVLDVHEARPAEHGLVIVSATVRGVHLAPVATWAGLVIR